MVKTHKLKVLKRYNTDQVRNRVIDIMYHLMRSDRSLTKKTFAFRIGIPATRISQWEDQTGTPTIETLVDLCKEFSVAPDFLLMGRGTMFGSAEVIARIESLETRVGELERVSGVVSDNGKSKR